MLALLEAQTFESGYIVDWDKSRETTTLDPLSPRGFRADFLWREGVKAAGFSRYLICPKCGKLLTGSASKGHTHYYSYYHCFGGCTSRFMADNVNQLFLRELKKYVPKPEMEVLYKITLQEAWAEKNNHLQDDRKQVTAQIKELENRLSYARDLVTSRQIDPADYRDMKEEYSRKLEKLEIKLTNSSNEVDDIKGLFNVGLNRLFRLDYIYENGDVEKKREVISSMFSEKMVFDGFALRITRINEAVQLIYNLDKGISENKKGQNGNNSKLSFQVGKTGFEPATPWSQTRCATGLRYFPVLLYISSGKAKLILAVREGFEPSVQFNPYGSLANC